MSFWDSIGLGGVEDSVKSVISQPFKNIPEIISAPVVLPFQAAAGIIQEVAPSVGNVVGGLVSSVTQAAGSAGGALNANGLTGLADLGGAAIGLPGLGSAISQFAPGNKDVPLGDVNNSAARIQSAPVLTETSSKSSSMMPLLLVAGGAVALIFILRKK